MRSVERTARLGILVLIIGLASPSTGGATAPAGEEAVPASPVQEAPEATTAGQAASGSCVTEVALTPVSPTQAALTVRATGVLTPHLFQLEDPDRVVLDLINANAAMPLTWKSEEGFCRQARWGTRTGKHGEPVVRYVIETRGPAACHLATGAGEVRLEIAAATEASAGVPPEAGRDESGQPEATGSGLAQADERSAEVVACGPAQVDSHPVETITSEPKPEASIPPELAWSVTPPDAAAMPGAVRSEAGHSAPWWAAPEARPVPRGDESVAMAGENALVTQESASKAEARAPVTEESASMMRESAPVTDEATAMAGENAAVTEENTSVADESAAMAAETGLFDPEASGPESSGEWTEDSASWEASLSASADESGVDPEDWRVASPETGGDDTERLLAQESLTQQEPLPRRAAASPGTFSLDVQSADIHGVLRSIAEYADINIIADNNVAGTLTIRALDLGWREMLDAVCQATGLMYVENGSIIRVATQKTAREEALAQESAARKQEEYMPLLTRVILVDYANAKELQETLAKSSSARGHVEYDPRTNALIVTDIPPRLDELAEMVRRLDTETIQVEIAAKIIDVDETAARQLGISWGVEDIHSSKANASGAIGVNAADVLDPVGEVRVGVIRSFGEIQAKLQALEQSNQAEIISSPRITTVSNRMARILVGKEVPLITLDFAGNAITELKKVGIHLEVTPHVNANDLITMDIHPEVSDLSSQSTSQGGNVFTTTEADTRVMVNNGETAVIGGLIRTSEIETESGVPYLRSVPVLGHLFKSSEKRNEKRELLIFITPRLIDPAGGTSD
jgi:type II secretory pathway component GspD/PulD (secretin)